MPTKLDVGITLVALKKLSAYLVDGAGINKLHTNNTSISTMHNKHLSK